ncbi:Cell division control protein 6 [Portunus trituberculatus]|uniref:Cell division control protein n=1 Tax=Portunus trituberculatus TaxID=210409 RepID=A0A5B7FHV8_PORTR|nr:Cell division control protein 6 [Portunus trituberculatus]
MIEKPHSSTVHSLIGVPQAPAHTAQDSKATEEHHTSTGPSLIAVSQTPECTAHHFKAECKSPSRSVVKRLNMNSPVKSPMKPLLLASPRRSPRKLNNENKASPQRSLMKALQSPLHSSSPSSLVSRLSLASPPSCKKNLAMGLFKPNVSAYRSLRQSLNTGTPSVLVCREKQADEIREFLTHHLTQGKPGSLYISGAPGTGKTASLNSNLESLQVKRIKTVFLNCMTLKTTAAIYKTIASELSLSVSSSERENKNAIEKALTISRHPILLMLDEVDQLDSKNQEVLYTIFEWPALPCSSLVLVGIANSLDLTDRILPRLQALPNFKPKLLHFPPYTKAEIVKIITHRIKEANLGEVQVIRPAAIQLLAGKVASIAGDVRKALDVCRRAVELCETQARKQAVLKPSNASPQKASKTSLDSVVPKMVEIPQILSIFNEVYGSRVVSAVTNAPESFSLQQKILICCLLLILKHARSKDVTLGKVFDHSLF